MFANFLRDRLGLLLTLHIVHRHVGPLRGQRQADAPPDPPPPSGYQCYLALQTSHLYSPFSF
jgi:hypothetical protein